MYCRYCGDEVSGKPWERKKHLVNQHSDVLNVRSLTLNDIRDCYALTPRGALVIVEKLGSDAGRDFELRGPSAWLEVNGVLLHITKGEGGTWIELMHPDNADVDLDDIWFPDYKDPGEESCCGKDLHPLGIEASVQWQRATEAAKRAKARSEKCEEKAHNAFSHMVQVIDEVESSSDQKEES